MIIRRMTQKDILFAIKLAINVGWTSEDRGVFRAFLFYDPEGCFIAEENQDPMGICIATAYQESGYFGELIVAPKYRNRGVGTRLLQTAMDYLKSKQVKSIYLDSVPAAISLYERHGFRKICLSLRFSGMLEGKRDPRVRPMQKKDLDTICSVDKTYFGEDRQFFLKWISFIGPDFAKVISENQRIVGYITGRYTPKGVQVGPWVMPSSIKNPEGLLTSLAKEVLNEPINIGVLETNKKSVRLLKSLGFKLKDDIPVHMAWGKKTDLGASDGCFAIGSAAKG
jgi:ribosomal protein S18 acetylase RimI-like enzyme